MPETVWIVQFLITMIVSGLIYDRRQMARELAALKAEVATLDSQHSQTLLKVTQIREIIEIKFLSMDKNIIAVHDAVRELTNEYRQGHRA